MAQAQFLVHEIEVIMQALAIIRNQICLACLLVVPWLVRRARLHGGENAHQPGVLAPPGQNLFYPVFLPEIPFADELDLDTGCSRHLLRVLANAVAERFGELRIIENPNLSLEQKRSHACRKTDLRQRAENQHPIPAAQHPSYLRSVPIRQ
ncbi:MAG TPA: hypothetical protein VGG62_13935 [Terracidiphilus sp.]